MSRFGKAIDHLSCVSVLEIHAYLDGTLPEEDVQAVETHLLLCVVCQNCLEQEMAVRRQRGAVSGSAQGNRKSTTLWGVDQRLTERTPTACPACVYAGGVAWRARLLDLSEGGLGLCCDAPLLPGQEVTVSAGDATFEGIVRYSKGTRFGVQLMTAVQPNLTARGR